MIDASTLKAGSALICLDERGTVESGAALAVSQQRQLYRQMVCNQIGEP
jgi:hypothetical protein